MTPETLFQIANPAALLGWGALVLSPLAPRLADILAGIVIPLALSVGYAGLVLAFWATAPGRLAGAPSASRNSIRPGAYRTRCTSFSTAIRATSSGV